jgi:TonB family protein
VTLRRLVVAGVFLGAVLGATPASAQQLPAAEAPVIVPPRVTVDRGVVYPDQALREGITAPVVVVLIVEVDEGGHVRSAVPVEAKGHGFDEAAVAAARQLAFDPATRDGRPIAAKITMRYTFTPPAPRLVGRVARLASDTPIAGARVVVRDATGAEHVVTTEADGTWRVPGLPSGPVHVTATAAGRAPEAADETLALGEETSVVLRLDVEHAAAAPDAGGLEEVMIRGNRPPREVTKRTLSRAEIERSPGTHGDALLSLQNLPGVARPPPLSGALAVRGSGPGDTNIFIDGTNVPLVYHFGGLSSVVPTEILQSIDFYPGNYGATYGRGMGGVVDVGLRDPLKTGYHALGQIDLLGARALVEGPIAGGWSFLAAAQRSWFDVILPPVLKATGAGAVALPKYADYQIELQKDFGSRSSFRFLFFGSDDAFDFVNPTPNATDPTLGGNLSYHTDFWRVQARFETAFSESTRLRLVAAYGQDTESINLGPDLLHVVVHPLSGRAELTHKLWPRVVVNAGLDVMYEPYDLTLQFPAITRPGVPAGGPGQPPLRSASSSDLFLPAGYVELELAPWSGARVVPGFRLDYDSATKRVDADPRITVRQAIRSDFPRTVLKAGIGQYHQPPNPLDTDPRFGQAHLFSNRSIQVDAGVEQEFTRQLDLSTDVFYKWMDSLVVPGAWNSGRGFAYGVEWLLRYKPDEHFFGWLSYTFSRSERSDVPGQPYYLFAFDQTHILTLVASLKLPRGWQLGARFRLTSGDPYTPTTTGAYDAAVGTQLGVSAYPIDGSRLPLFHQLDLRLDKVWTGRHMRLNFYVDLQNVYDSSNPFVVTYNYNFTKSAYVNGLPILPIIGLRGEFLP